MVSDDLHGKYQLIYICGWFQMIYMANISWSLWQMSADLCGRCQLVCVADHQMSADLCGRCRLTSVSDVSWSTSVAYVCWLMLQMSA